MKKQKNNETKFKKEVKMKKNFYKILKEEIMKKFIKIILLSFCALFFLVTCAKEEKKK